MCYERPPYFARPDPRQGVPVRFLDVAWVVSGNPPNRALKTLFDHPPAPFLARKGVENCIWGTPPDPHQRGITPLDSPLSATYWTFLKTGAHPGNDS